MPVRTRRRSTWTGRTAALRAVLILGQSHPDAAELADCKDTWVSDRVREWRRGDHRDLLPESEVPEENRTE